MNMSSNTWSNTVCLVILLYINFTLFQVFQGNHDRYTPVIHDLKVPIITRYIRIHPETWQSHISMRAELYGCKEGKSILVLLFF